MLVLMTTSEKAPILVLSGLIIAGLLTIVLKGVPKLVDKINNNIEAGK